MKSGFWSFLPSSAAAVSFLLLGLSGVAHGQPLTLDYPVSQNLYIPGSYAGRSFYYDRVHLGEDILLSEGTPVRAIADGRIVQYEYHSGYATSDDGTSIAAVIEHDLGRTVTLNLTVGDRKAVSVSKICSIYGHIRKSSTYGGTHLGWQVGNVVHKGDIIGYVNDGTHNGDGGVHLHLGIKLGGHPGRWVYYGYESSAIADSSVSTFAAGSEVIPALSLPVSVTDFFQKNSNGQYTITCFTDNLVDAQFKLINNSGSPIFFSTVAMALHRESDDAFVADVALQNSVTIQAGGTYQFPRSFLDGTNPNLQAGSYRLVAKVYYGGAWVELALHLPFTILSRSNSCGGGGTGGYPESPHPYPDNYNNTWTYTLANAAAINVTFDQQTQVESGYDYVYVMDNNGNNIAGSPFTGTSLAGQTRTVPGNTVRIRLTSDGSVTFFGFRITNVAASAGGGGGGGSNPTIQSSPASGPQLTTTFTLTGTGFTASGAVRRFMTVPPSNTTQELSGISANGSGQVTWPPFTPSCSDAVGAYTLWLVDVATSRESNHVTQTITANSTCSGGGGGGGTGGYPESPHPYPDNYNNTWTYTLANAAAINVTFDQQTQVESGWDNIYVMDSNGNNIAGSPFTGTALAGQTRTVPGSTVRIRLTSDGSVTYFGFRVTNVTASSGGGGGGGSTPTIQSSPASGPQLTTTFTLTGTGFTANGSVRRLMTVPPSNTTQELSAISANGSGQVTWPPFTPSCSDGVGTYTLWLVDAATNRESNRVTQTITANSSCSSGGGGTGAYPESPHPYPDNYNNIWTYTFPATASAISVTFDQQTQVESGWDYIYVMDSNGNNIAGSPFTGTALAGQTKTVPGNTVRIRLTSDGSVTYFGFRVTNVTTSSGGGGTSTRRTVFLIHGIGQSGGAMDALGITLRDPVYGIDHDRFGIDAGFDYGDCANTVFCSSGCTIQSIAQRLGQYIRARNPDGDIILVGYSLGGLVARDLMLNNYYGVFDAHRVAGLLTLGTPNVGYPYSSIDDAARCPVLIQQMASDYRARQSDNVVVESSYLYNLNTQWGSTSFVGRANQWLAVAGTCCTVAVRYPGGPGCQDNTRNDGVVCEQSAAFRLNVAGNQATQTWSDPNHQYSHTGGFLSFTVLESGAGAQPLYNPIASGELVTMIRSFINGL